MRGSEWVKKFEKLLNERENALLRYMEIPAHKKSDRDLAYDLLTATRRALIDFARSDGDVEAQDDHA
jgi:hypothetical protein